MDTVLFKFVNGNAWGFDENPEGECASQGNRFLALTGGDMVYEANPGQRTATTRAVAAWRRPRSRSAST